MRKFAYEFKKVRGILFDKWLVRLEKAAFGWQYCSTTEDYTGVDNVEQHINLSSDGSVSGTETRSPIFEKNLNFRRVKPYTDNFIFKLLELLSNIVSALRRFAVAILGPIVIFFVAFFILSMTACNDPSAKTSLIEWLQITAIVYGGGLFAPSFFLALLGFAFRKVFNIDEKLKQALEQNGYEYEN